MNSIVRIVLRGLLSGEIKPEPQVFERLKELSEGQYQRHPRILRFVRPSEADLGLADRKQPPQSPSGGKLFPAPRPRGVLGSAQPPSPRRRWPIFASVSCGRWIRLSAGLLVGGLVLALGAADVPAAVASEGESTWAPVSAEAIGTPAATAHTYGVMTAMLGVASVARPFPHLLLLASGTLLGGLLLRAGWRWYCRKQLFVMRPYEVALQELEATRFRAEHGKVPDPRRAVLGILRDYLQAQFRLGPPQLEHGGIQSVLTPGRVPLTPPQRWLLREVLECSEGATNEDPLPFAELTEKACRFVWATACCRPARRLLAGAAPLRTEPGK